MSMNSCIMDGDLAREEDPDDDTWILDVIQQVMMMDPLLGGTTFRARFREHAWG